MLELIDKLQDAEVFVNGDSSELFQFDPAKTAEAAKRLDLEKCEPIEIVAGPQSPLVPRF